MRYFWKFLTDSAFIMISLQCTIAMSCPTLKVLENVQIENQPIGSWTADDSTSSTENCGSLCLTIPECLSFLVERTTCKIYNTTLWTPEGIGLITQPGSGQLYYRTDLYKDSGLDWFPVYKISRGAGSEFFDLWTGNKSTSDVTSCHITPEEPCDTHYKHPIVEFRDQLRLNQMKVAVYKGGRELFSLSFEEGKVDKFNFWRRENVKNFTVPNQWTTTPTHLDLNVTPGAGFYFVGGKSPSEGAAVTNLFGVWDRVKEYPYYCDGYKPTPQILFSSHGNFVSLRQAGFVFGDKGGARYSQTFQSARELCQSHGARLATYDELDAARNDGGMSCCSCGFVQDGSQWFPMTYAHPNCRDSAGMHPCNQPMANAYCTFDGDTVEAADTFVIFIKLN